MVREAHDRRLVREATALQAEADRAAERLPDGVGASWDAVHAQDRESDSCRFRSAVMRLRRQAVGALVRGGRCGPGVCGQVSIGRGHRDRRALRAPSYTAADARRRVQRSAQPAVFVAPRRDRPGSAERSSEPGIGSRCQAPLAALARTRPGAAPAGCWPSLSGRGWLDRPGRSAARCCDRPANRTVGNAKRRV